MCKCIDLQNGTIIYKSEIFQQTIYLMTPEGNTQLVVDDSRDVGWLISVGRVGPFPTSSSYTDNGQIMSAAITFGMGDNLACKGES